MKCDSLFSPVRPGLVTDTDCTASSERVGAEIGLQCRTKTRKLCMNHLVCQSCTGEAVRSHASDARFSPSTEPPTSSPIRELCWSVMKDGCHTECSRVFSFSAARDFVCTLPRINRVPFRCMVCQAGVEYRSQRLVHRSRAKMSFSDSVCAVTHALVGVAAREKNLGRKVNIE